MYFFNQEEIPPLEEDRTSMQFCMPPYIHQKPVSPVYTSQTKPQYGNAHNRNEAAILDQGYTSLPMNFEAKVMVCIL